MPSRQSWERRISFRAFLWRALGKGLDRTYDILRHGYVHERVSVHQGSVVAVGGGEVIEVKLLVLQSWMDASKPTGSYSSIRR